MFCFRGGIRMVAQLRATVVWDGAGSQQRFDPILYYQENDTYGAPSVAPLIGGT